MYRQIEEDYQRAVMIRTWHTEKHVSSNMEKNKLKGSETK